MTVNEYIAEFIRLATITYLARNGMEGYELTDSDFKLMTRLVGTKKNADRLAKAAVNFKIEPECERIAAEVGMRFLKLKNVIVSETLQ
jgi:hypothetical protein